jgi:hypothetical protein
MTPTPHNTHAQALLPLVGYNTGTTAHPDNITIATSPNLGAQWARDDASIGRMARTSAPLPPTATPTLNVPLPPMLPPSVNNNIGIVPILDDTIDPTIIAQLRLASQRSSTSMVAPTRHYPLQQALLHTGDFSVAAGAARICGNNNPTTPSRRLPHSGIHTSYLGIPLQRLAD